MFILPNLVTTRAEVFTISSTFPRRRLECRGDVLSTRSIFIETIYVSNFKFSRLVFFFGFGLPFRCCTFLDFQLFFVVFWIVPHNVHILYGF